MTQQRVKPETLVDYGSAILRALGMPAADAELVLDSLVQADLWGHQSHGVLRLPWYAARLRSGAMVARTEPETLVDGGALLLLDGHAGVGQVLADIARREAVTRAREHGVGVVGVRNSNHFGTAMYYTRRAAHDGCVAILTTNASPAMAPWGGRKKVLGTNPWSIAAPSPTPSGVVAVDIANTAVARGKIYLARNRGEQIPDSWAMDSEGNITTDPTEAINGVILPMAGHKGYAITFMMDVLSGALTGSNTATRVGGPVRSRQAQRRRASLHCHQCRSDGRHRRLPRLRRPTHQRRQNHTTSPRQRRNLLPRRTRRPRRPYQPHRRRRRTTRPNPHRPRNPR